MGNNAKRKSKSVQTPAKNQSSFDKEIVNKLSKINDNLESVNRWIESSSKTRAFSGKNFALSVLIAVIATILSSIIISNHKQYPRTKQFPKKRI